MLTAEADRIYTICIPVLPEKQPGVSVRAAESATVRGKTRDSAKSRQSPEMTVTISLQIRIDTPYL